MARTEVHGPGIGFFDGRYVNVTGDTMTGNLSVSFSNSGATNEIFLRNGSNTASSNADFLIEVAGSSAGDPFQHFSIDTVTDWTVGVDNSDSDKFKIDVGATPGSSTALAIDVSKNVAIGVLTPLTDGTSGLVIKNAALTATVVNVDTTNKRFGINNTAPDADFHVTASTITNGTYFDVGNTGASRMVFEIFVNNSSENMTFECVKKGSGLRDFFLRSSKVYFDLKGTFNNYAGIIDGSNNRWGIGDNNTSPNSVLDVKGAIATAFVAKTANYTVLEADSVLTGDCTSGNLTFTLPTASGITGRKYTFKRIDASGNSVIVDGNSAETIDGAATKTLGSQYACIEIISNGTNWIISSQMGTIT